MVPATEQQRRIAFEALVLRALWIIILYVAGGRPFMNAISLRAHMLDYLGEHGRQTQEAKEYRETETFPSLPPSRI